MLIDDTKPYMTNIWWYMIIYEQYLITFDYI